MTTCGAVDPEFARLYAACDDPVAVDAQMRVTAALLSLCVLAIVAVVSLIA